MIVKKEIDESKVVVFRIGDEEYATGIDQVERIVEFEKITSIPDSPDYLKGVFNCLGRIVPVIDVKKRFKLSGTEIIDESKIIVAKQEHGDIGLVVDAVTEVMDVSTGTLQPPPETIAGIVKKFVKALIKQEKRIIIYLDLGTILDFNERETIDSYIE